MNVESIKTIDVYTSIPFSDKNNNKILLKIPVDSTIANGLNYKIDSTVKTHIGGKALDRIDLLFCANGREIDFNGSVVTGIVVLEY